MQHQGGGGSVFHFPLRTHRRGTGASQGTYSVLPFQNLRNWHWFFEDFIGDALDEDEHPLAVYDASASGTPTLDIVADAVGGQYQIQLANTNEAETAGLTFGGQLFLRGNRPFYFETRLKQVNTMAANQVLVWGLASDVDTTTLDNLTRNLWFRLDADSDLLIEADDNTTDQDDKDTGFNVTADTFYIYSIERGVDGTVYFSKADGNGENRKTWTLSKTFGGSEPSFSTNNLQPVILAQKSTGTTQPEIVVDYVLVGGERV